MHPRTRQAEQLDILVLGDPFYRAEVFAAQFAELVGSHRVRFRQLDGGAGGAPPPAEANVTEYVGTSAQVIALLEEDDVLVVHGAPVTERVLDAAPSLRLVCVGRGGPVNVDLQAASERGVRVVTTPGKNAEAVSELTVAFMIMLARGIPRSSAHLRGGGPIGLSAFEGSQWFGRELGGARLGLIGLGRVGRCVAERAAALGMRVQASDPFLTASDFPGDVDATDLPTLLATSDFVSLHARASVDNAEMLGPEQFALMRPQGFLINTARASLVDEAALADAIASGRIAGAALDVLRAHNRHFAHPLTRLDRVIVTPHIGGATHETLVRGARMIAAELERFAAGEPLRHAAEPSPTT